MRDVEQMIDAPTPHARIWLTPPCCGNYEHGEVTWCQDAVNECGNCGAPPTEYVPAARLSTLTAALAAVTAERDALREALLSDDAITAAVLAHWGEPPINKVSAHLRSNQMRHAIRAALTANHSAPVVEE